MLPHDTNHLLRNSRLEQMQGLPEGLRPCQCCTAAALVSGN
jgi:hypothetical protein